MLMIGCVMWLFVVVGGVDCDGLLFNLLFDFVKVFDV